MRHYLELLLAQRVAIPAYVSWLLLLFVANCAYARIQNIHTEMRISLLKDADTVCTSRVTEQESGKICIQANPFPASTPSNPIVLCLRFNTWYIRSIIYVHFVRFHRLILPMHAYISISMQDYTFLLTKIGSLLKYKHIVFI